MELDEAIRNRRSIRKYTDVPIPDGHLRAILQSAIEAPSAGNLQSRFFYVVKDADLRGAMARAALHQDFIGQAPIAVVVCADSGIRKEYGDRGVELYAPLDCAAAIENMLLTAHSLGLGSCWVGAFNEKRLVDIVGIPAHLRPIAIVTLGYPAESPPRPARISVEKVTVVK